MDSSSFSLSFTNDFDNSQKFKITKSCFDFEFSTIQYTNLFTGKEFIRKFAPFHFYFDKHCFLVSKKVGKKEQTFLVKF